MGLLSSMMGPQGVVGHYGLTDWWDGLFTHRETDALEKAYVRRRRPSGGARGESRPIGLTRGPAQGYVTDQSAARFLASLAPLVGQIAHEREPAVWAKAEELALESGDVLDLHAVYSGAVKAFYARRKEDKEFLDAALEAAVELVSMADEVAAAYRAARPGRTLPPHSGYKLLAVLAERRGDREEALSLSRRALQQGWAGDWQQRVARLERVASPGVTADRSEAQEGPVRPTDEPTGGRTAGPPEGPAAGPPDEPAGRG